MDDQDCYWPKWAKKLVAAAVAVAAVAVTVVTLVAAAPAAVCTLTTSAMMMGASYAVASAVATTAVVATTTVAATYAGDVAYSAVTGDSPLKETVFQGNQEAYDIGLMITDMFTVGLLQLATQSPQTVTS